MKPLASIRHIALGLAVLVSAPARGDTTGSDTLKYRCHSRVFTTDHGYKECAPRDAELSVDLTLRLRGAKGSGFPLRHHFTKVPSTTMDSATWWMPHSKRHDQIGDWNTTKEIACCSTQDGMSLGPDGKLHGFGLRDSVMAAPMRSGAVGVRLAATIIPWGTRVHSIHRLVPATRDTVLRIPDGDGVWTARIVFAKRRPKAKSTDTLWVRKRMDIVDHDTYWPCDSVGAELGIHATITDSGLDVPYRAKAWFRRGIRHTLDSSVVVESVPETLGSVVLPSESSALEIPLIDMPGLAHTDSTSRGKVRTHMEATPLASDSVAIDVVHAFARTGKPVQNFEGFFPAASDTVVTETIGSATARYEVRFLKPRREYQGRQ